MNRLHNLLRRTVRRSRAVRRPSSLFVEHLETRQLLTGGPLTLTITELGTMPLQTVTIVDNGAGDTNSAIGSISYSTPANSPFTDFSVQNFLVTSNRTFATTTARLNANGKIQRTTTTDGPQVLE